MAYLETPQDDEQRRLLQSSGPGQSFAPASVTSGGATSAPEPSGTGGAAPIASYFTANEPAAQAMAQGMADKVQATGKEAVQNWDSGKAVEAQQEAANLGTQEGIAQNLHDQYSDPRYTSGMAGLDSYLATRGSGGAFDKIKNQFGALDWNAIGTPEPTAPTARDVGAAPVPSGNLGFVPLDPAITPPTAADGQPVHTISPQGTPFQSGTYEDQSAQNVWKKQKADAESEYAQAKSAYDTNKSAWDARRKPLLDAFGL